MATVEKRVRAGKKRWLARYRTPEGDQRSMTFDLKTEADAYLVGIENAKLTGSYVDPKRAKVTVGEWSAKWLAAQAHLKPTTRARYEGIVSYHIVPRWGRTPLSHVSHADVASWVSELDALAPASVRYVHRVFSLLLELAVRDGRLSRNPAQGVRLPKTQSAEKRFLTTAEVFRLADCAASYPLPEFGAQNRVLVLTLAFCGLRWGELAALKVGRVDLMRRRLSLVESVTEVRGTLKWGTLKTHQARSVPFPAFLADLLVVTVAGKDPADLVFTSFRGKTLRNLNYRRDVFDRAAEDAGLTGLTPHELRHTAASLAVSAGASVKGVQRMLGHASAAMTLDVYAGLFDADLDAVADRLSASVADVYPLCNDTVVSPLRKQGQ